VGDAPCRERKKISRMSIACCSVEGIGWVLNVSRIRERMTVEALPFSYMSVIVSACADVSVAVRRSWQMR